MRYPGSPDICAPERLRVVDIFESIQLRRHRIYITLHHFLDPAPGHLMRPGYPVRLPADPGHRQQPTILQCIPDGEGRDRISIRRPGLVGIRSDHCVSLRARDFPHPDPEHNDGPLLGRQPGRPGDFAGDCGLSNLEGVSGGNIFRAVRVCFYLHDSGELYPDRNQRQDAK